MHSSAEGRGTKQSLGCLSTIDQSGFSLSVAPPSSPGMSFGMVDGSTVGGAKRGIDRAIWLRSNESQRYLTASLIARAAATIAARAGRTSSQRRVLSPQSGFTQSWEGDNTLQAFFKRPSISSSAGMRGEWMS